MRKENHAKEEEEILLTFVRKGLRQTLAEEEDDGRKPPSGFPAKISAVFRCASYRSPLVFSGASPHLPSHLFNSLLSSQSCRLYPLIYFFAIPTHLVNFSCHEQVTNCHRDSLLAFTKLLRIVLIYLFIPIHINRWEYEY